MERDDLKKGMVLLFREWEEDTAFNVEWTGYLRELRGFETLDVLKAARHFKNNRHKFKSAMKRWPLAGELSDILKDWGIQRKAPANALPMTQQQESFNQAWDRSSAWYMQLMANAPATLRRFDGNQMPYAQMGDVLAFIKEAAQENWERKERKEGYHTFAYILATGWFEGVFPEKFNQQCKG